MTNVHSDTNEHHVVFEAFEVTPTCEQVLAAKDALLRDFPGCAVTVPEATFLKPSFLDSFVSFMQQASTELVTKFSSITYKAAAPLPEIRDTSDPALVTGLLMAILEANGTTAEVPILRKRVRDTVMFDHAYRPWRRSALYLTVRVGIQRHLYKQFGPVVGRLHYKTIMCLMLQQFLEVVLKKISFESISFLRRKLGRRLAKLSSDRAAIIGKVNPAVVSAFDSLHPVFEKTLLTTGRWLKAVWRNYKTAHGRRIPLLEICVPNGAFNFRLANSRPILSSILANQAVVASVKQRSPDKLLKQYDESAASVKPYMHAARTHIQISQHCSTVIEPAKEADICGDPRILELSELIHDYIHRIQTSPVGYPDQKSQMLLHLMELWILMDAEAAARYPLLRDYHPGFDTDLLDPIQLLSMGDMMRAQKFQEYISERLCARRSMRSRTIFDDPDDHCFAVRYFDEYSKSVQSLRLEIESNANKKRVEKEAEWLEKSELHAEVIRKRDKTACVYDDVPHRYLHGVTESKHRKPCDWHDLRVTARSIRVRIFEHPLPSYEPAAKAVMFELRCPKSFAAYRDATWSILSIICSQLPTTKVDRVSLVREFSELQPYIEDTNDSTCSVTLASEKKAFLETHYASWGFPVELDNIIRTCGLKPRYYDGRSQSWTGRNQKASLWHHFPLMLGTDSPYHVLRLSFEDWPSSNDIQSSQAECPADISSHEFMAWQGLLVGTHSRWLDLVRELGSTNLNFSADATWVLVIRLILQIGPASMVEEACRDVHAALLDDSLCARLLHQIHQRLDAIHHNWREPVQMDILITVLLKVISLTSSNPIRQQSTALLLQARDSTDLWRVELQSVVTNDAKVRPFAIWASILCKRTLHTDWDMLEPVLLQQYIGASISLNYNLVEDFKYLPYHLRSAIIRDVMFSYEYRHVLRQSILSNAQGFVAAINQLWQVPEGYEPIVSDSAPNAWWILLELKPPGDDHSHSHFVHYNYVYGTLLIDGQEMSTLPLTYRRNALYREIFGDRNPIVFPSPLPGMSWAVSEAGRGGHRLHLGFRQRTLIVRTVHQDQIHEFVPAEVFGKTSFDLPAPLRTGCYHWLNVTTGVLEIRRQDMWISKLNNWWIYGISFGQCKIIRRSGHSSETTLLNASNETVQRISAIFRSFVDPRQILVFASRDGRITAELKPLELSFFINSSGLLQSLRLGAIVSEDQDAGTWYGLNSKLVIQSAANRRQKSILVPLNNDFHITRDGIHVSIDIGIKTDKYLKYDINEVLGRIDCPPEPSLLYTSALLHALTSHVVPDPLTGRTGVDEALRLLQTGLYQPWSPLGENHIALLHRLAELSPMRGYYPMNSRFMETLLWRPELTRHVQDDRLRPYVEKILQRNISLVEFYHGVAKQESRLDLFVKPNPHLAARAVSRSYVQHHRDDDMEYSGRDKRRTDLARANTLYISRQLIMQQPSPVDSPSLLSLLHGASLVGGYDTCFRKNQLTDLLAVDIRAEWGALTQRALLCDAQDRYSLIFLLGPIAFSPDANTALLHKLISLVMCPAVKELIPPQHAAYFHFRADGAPPSSYLVSLMEKARMPFIPFGFKKRAQVVVAENNHVQYVERSCEALACSIQAQWPQTEIAVTKLAHVDDAHVDANQALKDIMPEWQRLTQNHELATYLEHVQSLLDHSSKAGARSSNPDAGPIPTCPSLSAVSKRPDLYPSRNRKGDDPSLPKLLLQSISGTTFQPEDSWITANALMPKAVGILSRHNISLKAQTYAPTGHLSKTRRTPEITELMAIMSDFRAKASHVYSRYADEMESSIDALGLHIESQQNMSQPAIGWITNDDLRIAKDNIGMIIERVKQGLTANDPQAKWLQLVDLWPNTTAADLLTELRSSAGHTFGSGTKEALVSMGVAVTKLQQLLRIQDAQKRRKDLQRREECINRGHTNWNPIEYTDWLLLEIDGNVMLREEQIQVALATIAPASGQNSVLQLLMGKGKTSCILRE